MAADAIGTGAQASARTGRASRDAWDIARSATGAVPLRYPAQGYHQHGARRQEVLLICYYDPVGISTVPETVAFLQAGSRFAVTVLNLFEHRVDNGYLRLHEWLDLTVYAALVIHNTVAYNVANLESLDAGLSCKLRDYRGAKIVLKQDENFRFRELARYIGETGFDVVFTCLPPEAVPLVYPPEVVGPNVRFERMLTGYVTPTLRARDPMAAPRTIDIGYRGSVQPVFFGWLAYEKRKIASDVLRLTQGETLRVDISSRWEDRLGGEEWLAFLSSCKATLGAESGASIFDLDGTLDSRIAALEERFAGIGDEVARAEAILRGLSDLEGNVRYHQIAPRHFEAAACGTLQLLYPGDYSGLFVAGRHYFPLERDYSNFGDALALLRDDARRQEMARRAFDEVILDRRNWIESFVERVDDAIGSALERKGANGPKATFASPPAQANVLVLVAHDPVLDPRVGWIEEGAPAGLAVHQLGALQPGGTAPRRQVTSRGHVVEALERCRWRPDTLLPVLAAASRNAAGMAGAQELLFFDWALRLPDAEFCELFGAAPSSPRVNHLKSYLQYLLDTAQTLIDGGLATRGAHALVATDLDTLPAALVLKGLLGAPLLYDAHEYWPESNVDSSEAERQFWIDLERRLVPHADARQTVSPGLAALMASQYGVPFSVVPNCEPRDRLVGTSRGQSEAGTVVFLFQGIFAPGRGIDLMIDAWPATDERAVLHLRGPAGAYKNEMAERARSTGLLGSRILFPDPVPEEQLVLAASQADVGVVSYTPTGTNYRHCCPNKCSQYMAAGIPILANRTEFVAALVDGAGCGLVCDFSRSRQLIQSVRSMCDSAAQRRQWGESGREFFAARFNWNVVSHPMYDTLLRLATGPAVPFETYRPPVAALRKLRVEVQAAALVLPAGECIAPVPPAAAPVEPGATAAAEQLSRSARLRAAAVLVWSCVPEGARSVLRPVVNGVLRPAARQAHRFLRGMATRVRGNR